MRKLLVALTLALGAGLAHADSGMLYLGAGVSHDDLKDIAATNSSLNSTSWKAWAGVRPIKLFGIEADYIDLGSQSPAINTHLSYKAFTGSAVGFAPIPVPYVDVFGKVGLARWTASGAAQIPLAVPAPVQFRSLSDNGTQFAWGIGGQVHLGNFGARLEYEHFSIRNTNGADIVSLSIFLNVL